MKHSHLTTFALALGALIAVVVACRSKDDPGVAGNGAASGGTSSGSNVSSSSGGIDATVPDGPIDCGPAPGAAGAFTKQALLGAAADCAAWHACGFQNAATALRTAVRGYAATPNDAQHALAQAAWKGAMGEWSKMELFQFGPLASRSEDTYHGRGLRSFVHPWPDHNRCQIEAQIVSRDYERGWDLVFPNSRGLFGLEYLLHYPGTDTACLPQSTTGKAWTTLTPDQLVKSKTDYAVALADNVAALALEIRNVWLPEGENFKARLLAFEGYGSEQEALNVVAWALFYEESEVKDHKLAARAGIKTTAPTPETPFGLVEVENVRTNIRAFRELFQGCSADGTGIGFDDWLVAAGQEALSQNILTALAQAQTAADAFPAFGSADQPKFLELYEAVKPLSDLLKTSVFGSSSPLNLKLPAIAASDTD
jgi:uncharacterized protein